MAAAVIGGLFLGAIISAIHAGLNALGEVGLQAIIEAGRRDRAIAQRALDHRRAIAARMLVGRVLCVTFASAFAALWFYSRLGLGAALIAIAVVALTYGAVASVTTTIIRRRGGRLTLRLLRWIKPAELLVWPIAAPLAWLARVVERFVPEQNEDHSGRVTELAVEHAIGQGEETGSIGLDHAQMLRSVLEFKNTVAREIMVPRTQMVAFEVATPIEEVLNQIMESEHSRYPVYREHLDQVEGILYAKDLFRVMKEHPDHDGVHLCDLMRESVFFAAETQKIGVLLREMQRRRLHLAVVVDEFGGAAGIVTLEDILEEIVGEIQDEHDEETPLVSPRGDGHYIVDASISVYDLEEVFGESIVEDKSDFDTLGGLILQLAGRVPAAGESLRAGAFDIHVLEADDRRVSRVEIVKIEVSEEAPNAASG